MAKEGYTPEEQVATQRAMVAQEQATIANDQAAVEYAKAELGYTKLVAPFDGVTRIRLLDVGNIIQPTNGSASPSNGQSPPNQILAVKRFCQKTQNTLCGEL